MGVDVTSVIDMGCVAEVDMIDDNLEELKMIDRLSEKDGVGVVTGSFVCVTEAGPYDRLSENDEAGVMICTFELLLRGGAVAVIVMESLMVVVLVLSVSLSKSFVATIVS